MSPTLTPADHEPQLQKTAFDCPRCGAYANQTWTRLYREINEEEWGGDQYEKADEGPFRRPKIPRPDPSQAGAGASSVSPMSGIDFANAIGAIGHREGEWWMAKCVACEDYSVWRSEWLIYPKSSTIPAPSADMPSEVAVLYEEARSVIPVSRRAGAALARATLEKLLKSQDPGASADDSLATRIEAVIPKVSSSLAKLLTLIRHIGNKSLHVEDTPDDAVVLVLDPGQTEIVEVIFGAINELVDELITKPKAADAFLALVPKNVTDNVKGL
jgi:hypothetical protein